MAISCHHQVDESDQITAAATVWIMMRASSVRYLLNRSDKWWGMAVDDSLVSSWSPPWLRRQVPLCDVSWIVYYRDPPWTNCSKVRLKRLDLSWYRRWEICTPWFRVRLEQLCTNYQPAKFAGIASQFDLIVVCCYLLSCKLTVDACTVSKGIIILYNLRHCQVLTPASFLLSREKRLRSWNKLQIE